MLISSLRSSSKLARPEDSGATFLITGPSSQVLAERSDDVCAFGASCVGVTSSVVLLQIY